MILLLRQLLSILILPVTMTIVVPTAILSGRPAGGVFGSRPA